MRSGLLHWKTWRVGGGAFLFAAVVAFGIHSEWWRVEFGPAETGVLLQDVPEVDGAPVPLPLDAALAAAQSEPPVDAAEDHAGIVPASFSETVSDEPSFPASVDLDGNVHAPGQTAGVRAVVVVFLSLDCPISNGYLPELNRLAAKWWTEGVELYGVISGGSTTREAARRHRSEYRVQFPVLYDPARAWLSLLQPSHTPQAFVLNANGETRYSGRIDDQYAGPNRKTTQPGRPHLELAVESVLRGDAVEIARTEPFGCLVERPDVRAADGTVTYARDIAPIVQHHCAGCHRPGAVAPFPLLTYEDVRWHARQIAFVVGSGVMPPWKPVGGWGRFRDERRLSGRQIELLQQWVDAGCPEGDAPHEVSLPATSEGSHLGEPDLILQLPEPFDVPANTADVYQYFVLPTGLLEDRWVKAIEFRPSNPSVVHHASFSYDLAGRGRQFDAADPSPGYARFGGPGFRPDGTLGGWGPGLVPHPLPPGTARLLPRGSDLIVQIHYHPTGKPERDQSVVGLYFAREPIDRRIGEILVANFELRIPSGASRHEHHASYTLPADALLHAVTPHMHLLGREIEAIATTPDGKVEKLVRIEDWDFNWHDQYVYSGPVRLPRGTRIDVRAVYDNSPSNPFNPNSPSLAVQWGERTVDEMGICFFDITTDRPEDLPRLIEHNREYQARQILANPWLLEPPRE